MSFLIFPCRVLAPDFADAQEKIVGKLLERELQPTEEPQPFPCPVQSVEGQTWWECYAKCEEVG